MEIPLALKFIAIGTVAFFVLLVISCIALQHVDISGAYK